MAEVNCETVLAVRETTIRPFVPSSPRSVPTKSWFPSRLKSNESGVAGNVPAVPTALAGVVSGTILLTQPSVVPQPVLATQTVVLALAPVTTKLIAFSG